MGPVPTSVFLSPCVVVVVVVGQERDLQPGPAVPILFCPRMVGVGGGAGRSEGVKGLEKLV